MWRTGRICRAPVRAGAFSPSASGSGRCRLRRPCRSGGTSNSLIVVWTRPVARLCHGTWESRVRGRVLPGHSFHGRNTAPQRTERHRRVAPVARSSQSLGGSEPVRQRHPTRPADAISGFGESVRQTRRPRHNAAARLEQRCRGAHRRVARKRPSLALR